MTKFLPFEDGVHNKNHFFVVTIMSPDDNHPIVRELFTCVIYSYVDDIAVISELVKSYTKYNFTISKSTQDCHSDYKNEWSINQACQYLKRLRFYKKEIVTKTKTITWNEEIETEL